ncbi:MAG: phosphoenolpyruvate carboxykinase domain-containing protein [Ilumatobacteraceae bacterium]
MGQQHLHQHRADQRGRCLVGRHERREACSCHRLEGQRLDARDRHPGSSPECPVHRSAEQCPCIAPEWQDPKGVPISAILFGGRRRTTVPLVTQAFDWEHGVFLGATMASETTAAAGGAVGNLRFDPMAMLPFCGYNMADYFGHWLDIAKHTDEANLPKIFYVNWFRRDDNGRFLWPGFGENSRVLKWVFERVNGDAGAVETAIGLLPGEGDLDTSGLQIDAADLHELLSVDAAGWKQIVPEIRQHFARFGDRLPAPLTLALDNLNAKLSS